jgi:hypothetical protein
MVPSLLGARRIAPGFPHLGQSERLDIASVLSLGHLEDWPNIGLGSRSIQDPIAGAGDASRHSGGLKGMLDRMVTTREARFKQGARSKERDL